MAMSILCGITFFNRSIISSSTKIIEQSFSCVLYPFLKLQRGITDSCKNVFQRRKTAQELEEALERVSAERQELLSQVVMLQASQRFAQENAELFAFKKRYQEKLHCLSQVLVRHISDTGHFFLVDAGSWQGIAVDMIAVYKNCLLGRVSEVYPYYSKIVLITDSSCKIAAYSPATQACGIHEGVNQDTMMLMNYVNHLQQIKKHDLILSSGEGLVFPRGFALGTVQYAEVDGVHYAVRLAPLIDIHTINYCYLMKK